MLVVKVDCTWFNYWLSACGGGAAQYGQTQTKSSLSKTANHMAHHAAFTHGIVKPVHANIFTQALFIIQVF